MIWRASLRLQRVALGGLVLVMVTLGCVLMGCRGESQATLPIDEHVRSPLSPDIREKLESTRVPVLLPGMLAQTQISSLEVTGDAYELLSQSGGLRIRVRGDALKANGGGHALPCSAPFRRTSLAGAR